MKRKSQQLDDPPDICMRGQTGEAALCTEENTKHRSSEGTSSDPVLEPKHKIFLSHSGAQKEFVEHLCEALERRFHYPFFDKRPSSLPKGEKFPGLIIQAAQQCEMAIVVVSEEYFMSKWPMVELNAFVQARRQESNKKLRILPLFYGLSVSEFREKRRRERWHAQWESFAKDDAQGRIKVHEWKDALGELGSFNGMSYNRELKEIVAYVNAIVSCICHSIVPDIKWDDSHVQGKSNICEVVWKNIEQVGLSRRYNVKVVGLYGVGGIGKTTLCKILCNELSHEYEGRVCHVEFENKGTSSKGLLEKVLMHLTNTSLEVLQQMNEGECRDILRRILSRKRTFLAVDNVWDDHHSIEQAKMFLEGPFCEGSLVIVTSRSQRTLELLGVDGDASFEVPDLGLEDAMNLFLYHAVGGKRFVKEEEKRDILECLQRCYFQKGDGGGWHYHPLALEALGSQLSCLGDKPSEWVENLWRVKNFSYLSGGNPVFGILRSSFDLLPLCYQSLFMDLVFYNWLLRRSWEIDMKEWLCVVHKHDEVEIKCRLDSLKRRGLLQEVDLASGRVSVHDLYREFAELEVRGKLDESTDLETRRWGYVDDGDLSELESSPSVGLSHKLIRLRIQFGCSEDITDSLELTQHEIESDVILQIRNGGLANMESEVQVPIPGDCYDFGKHDDVSICELMHEEIMKIGNISEASLKDLEGEEIIVLCNYIAKDDLLEFYFKHGEDMTSVAGVGLNYAKVVLIEGWRVKVEEILEEDWVQAWKKVESSSTTRPKLLRVESDALIRSKKEVFTGKEILKPLLWDLAKYFTLNESIDSLVKSTTTSSSHGQNSRGSTSDGSSSNPQGSYGNDNRGGFQEAIPKWFNSKKKQGGNNGEDNNDDEGNDNKGKAPNPSPSDGEDNDLKWSKVFVDLLPGGDVLEESKFSLTERKKLRTLDGTISPHLEFSFQKKSENKEIEVIVGNVQFNLGFAKHGGSDQVKWIHDDMGISFGLQGDNQAFGELVRNSFKHFDIVNTRKETVSESHTNERTEGRDYNAKVGFHATIHGVGPTANIGGKQSKTDANSQQHERSSETSCAILEGGMKFRQIRDSNDERQIRCEYFFPREKDNTINLSTSPMSFIQDVRFQATWTPLDVKPNGISRDFVVYTLEVGRNLEEIVGETTNLEEFVEVNVNTSEAEIPQHGGPIKYIQKLFNRGRKTNAAQKASTSESDTSQHGGPVKCKQFYKKTLYINHAMTNLDSKTHELKEVKENSDKFQYFCPVKNRKFYDNGSPKPYVWVNGALVKLEEESEPSSVATTSATPALSVRNPRNKDVASTSATPTLSRTCNLCKKPTEQRWPCSRCQMMNYCTRSCRVKHWIGEHKSECRPVDANASRGVQLRVK